jgi:nitrite reductase/ring-hydroxylating ferredoxin subunit
MQRDIVLFRDSAGQFTAAEAACPHLGAHLGQGGTVEDGQIVCPFHGFRFRAGDGACVSTPYGPPPPAARLRLLATRELFGALLVWHGPDPEPDWEVEVPDAPGDWLPVRTTTLRHRGHPQEVTENSVDLGHLAVLHGFENVTVLEPLHLDGPHLRTRYAIRAARIPVLTHVEAEFLVCVDGLGFSRVELTFPRLGLRLRQLVLPTPIDEEHIDLRLAISVQRRAPIRYWPAAFWPPIAMLIRWAALRRFTAEIQTDITVWAHKHYIVHPALSAGDGPIGRYRRWVRQFYPSADNNIHQGQP